MQKIAPTRRHLILPSLIVSPERTKPRSLFLRQRSEKGQRGQEIRGMPALPRIMEKAGGESNYSHRGPGRRKKEEEGGAGGISIRGGISIEVAVHGQTTPCLFASSPGTLDFVHQKD